MYSYGLDTLKKAAGLLKVNCQVQVVTQYEQILEACISQGFPVYMNPAPDLGIASSMQLGLQHNLHKDACLFMVADAAWPYSRQCKGTGGWISSFREGHGCVLFSGENG